MWAVGHVAKKNSSELLDAINRIKKNFFMGEKIKE
jgi:hypothetical protein